MLTTKKGRPTKGSTKRIRTSFTLEPRHIAKLESWASELGISKSEVLDIVIQESETLRSNTNNMPQCMIPIHKSKIANFCKSKGIRKIALFGSVLNTNFTKDSDIDLLVEFGKDHVPTLFEIAAYEWELSEIFQGRKVDLRTKADLGRHIRKKVADSALTIYEAAG